ncbi:hypothetical protein PC128_g13258 [Phytophthora cactorum]|nr:hypothetical protein PC128_g13258 [Phytophthora cactorum]
MAGGSGNDYYVLYNYGEKGNGQRVLACKTHSSCGNLFRVGFSDEDGTKVITLEEPGEHEAERSGATKTEINPHRKRESDELL